MLPENIFLFPLSINLLLINSKSNSSQAMFWKAIRFKGNDSQAKVALESGLWHWVAMQPWWYNLTSGNEVGIRLETSLEVYVRIDLYNARIVVGPLLDIS